MNRHARFGPAAVALVLVGAAALSGCGQKTSIRFEPYSVASRAPGTEPRGFLAHLVELLYEPLVPKAQAAITDVQMCFKRLRFKIDDRGADGTRALSSGADSSPSEDNFDLQVGLVTLTPEGTELTEVEVPDDVYRRVEFDLKDECGTGFALRVTNENGTFSEARHTKIWFEGRFEGTQDELALNIQSVLERLTAVTSSEELKDAAESVGGRF